MTRRVPSGGPLHGAQHVPLRPSATQRSQAPLKQVHTTPFHRGGTPGQAVGLGGARNQIKGHTIPRMQALGTAHALPPPDTLLHFFPTLENFLYQTLSFPG